METEERVVHGYLVLALRLGRLGPGLVDAGMVGPALRQVVDGGPAPRPADVVRQAGRLARDLPAAGLAPAREHFLAAQLRAVEWTARRLTGQAVPFSQEARECFGTSVWMGDDGGYRSAHRELDALLPGPGALASRLAGYRRREEIPRARLGAGVQALSEALRMQTRAVVPLPAGESVEYRIVDDAPWSALHQYLGGFRSRITVNAGARPRRTQLAQLVAHEAYPGHHTESCRKEAGLVARGWEEHRVVLATSPQSLIAEGAAELGLHVVVGPGWGRLAAEVLTEVGLGFDGELAERVDAACTGLGRVRQDAALLLHDRRVPADEVIAHIRRWMLVDDRRAGEVLRFLQHPLWRAYTTTYVEGAALLRRWCAAGPGRFLRLLDEPLTPDALRVDLATTGGSEQAMGGRPPELILPPCSRDDTALRLTAPG